MFQILRSFWFSPAHFGAVWHENDLSPTGAPAMGIDNNKQMQLAIGKTNFSRSTRGPIISSICVSIATHTPMNLANLARAPSGLFWAILRKPRRPQTLLCLRLGHSKLNVYTYPTCCVPLELPSHHSNKGHWLMTSAFFEDRSPALSWLVFMSEQANWKPKNVDGLAWRPHRQFSFKPQALFISTANISRPQGFKNKQVQRVLIWQTVSRETVGLPPELPTDTKVLFQKKDGKLPVTIYKGNFPSFFWNNTLVSVGSSGGNPTVSRETVCHIRTLCSCLFLKPRPCCGYEMG